MFREVHPSTKIYRLSHFAPFNVLMYETPNYSKLNALKYCDTNLIHRMVIISPARQAHLQVRCAPRPTPSRYLSRFGKTASNLLTCADSLNVLCARFKPTAFVLHHVIRAIPLAVRRYIL